MREISFALVALAALILELMLTRVFDIVLVPNMSICAALSLYALAPLIFRPMRDGSAALARTRFPLIESQFSATAATGVAEV